ncbi:MAG: hypothetical protein AAF074_20505 [Pseudomonadota bacterium]
MSTIFKGGTNGGANRFFTKDGEKILVAGADVAGRPEVSGDAALLAEVWGAIDFRDNGDVTGSDEVNINLGNDDAVRINGGDVSGNYTFFFGSADDAMNFADFLEEVTEAGYIDELLG